MSWRAGWATALFSGGNSASTGRAAGKGLAGEARKVVEPLAESWFKWEKDPAEYEKGRARLAELIVGGGN